MSGISAEAIERGELPPALDPASPEAQAVVAFMAEYFRRWNAKDAKALATEIYREEPHLPLQTEADFQRLLERTQAEGWDYSTLDGLQVFPWEDGAWLARGRFNRFRADGTLMPPADRLTAYVIRKFPDGLRITDLPLAYGR